MQHFFFVFFLSFVFWQCTSPSESVKRYQSDVYIRYDALGKEGYAEATFKEMPIQPQSPPIVISGGVEFQQKKMTAADTTKPVYRVKFSEPADSFHVFWRDKAATRHNHLSVFMPRIDSFWFETPGVALSTPARLHWTGGGLKKGETLVLLWQQQGKTVTTEVYNPSGMNMLELPAVKLQELQPGRCQLYLVRKRLVKMALSETGTPAEQTGNTTPAVEASVITEYYTQPRSFEVVR